MARPAHNLEAYETTKMVKTNRLVVLIAIVTLMFIISPFQPLYGSDAPTALERRIELDKLADIDERAVEIPAITLSSRIDFRYGGWFRSLYYDYTDYEDSSNAALNLDLRLWSQLQIDETHTFYVRPQINYLKSVTGDSFGEDVQFKDLRLNVGFYDMDVARFLDNTLGFDRLQRLHFTAGRKFFSIGSGLLFARRADGIEMRGKQGDFEYLLFAADTVSSDDDEDQSRPDNGNSERRFYGTQISFTHCSAFQPYVILFRQRDHNDRHPTFGGQAYVYNSDYVGIGFNAFIGSRLKATAEWISESGRSSSEGFRRGTESIDASALVVKLEAPVGKKHDMRLFCQYLFGSGDSDRFDPTNTIGGNVPGTPDHSFQAFGFVDTGWAMSPTLSNLHVFQLGAAAKPIDNLEIGAAVYSFHKEHAEAGVSDPGASEDSHNVGQELDVFANWAVFSDLTVSAVLGHFWDGSAMTHGHNRPFVQVSVTYAF